MHNNKNSVMKSHACTMYIYIFTYIIIYNIIVHKVAGRDGRLPIYVCLRTRRSRIIHNIIQSFALSSIDNNRVEYI